MKPRIFIAAGLTLLLAGPASAEDPGHAAQLSLRTPGRLCAATRLRARLSTTNLYNVSP